MSNESIFGKLRLKGGGGGAGTACVDNYKLEGGLTIRDYFAGLAMQGMVSDPRNLDGRTINLDAQIIAQWAYGMADAMLGERSK